MTGAQDELVIRERDSDVTCRIEYLDGDALHVHGPAGDVIVQGSLDGDGIWMR